jgi:hypothetical protein
MEKYRRIRQMRRGINIQDLRQEIDGALQSIEIQPPPSLELMRYYLGRISFLVSVIEGMDPPREAPQGQSVPEWMLR